MIECFEDLRFSFVKGQGLNANDLNELKNRINELGRTMNLWLKAEVNVNFEEQKPEQLYTFAEAIALVPESRRVPGVKVRFNSLEGWQEVVWQGGTWNNELNWSISLGSNIVDGGEW